MRFIVVILFVFSFLVSSGQTKGQGKLYGYRELVIAGKSPETIDEYGGEPEAVKPDNRFNYYIFLSTPSRVYPSEIWLNGKPYAAKMQTVQTPVVYNNDASMNKQRELVPKTDRIVLELSPTAAVESKLSKQGKLLSKGNELVVIYKQGSKFYYCTLKTLSELENKPLQ